MRFLFIGLLVLAAPLLAQQPIGHTSATEVQVSGAVNISHGETTLGNGSEITAGNQAVKITLERGGELRLCSTSSVHLSKDRSIDDPANSALMIALNRGAIEANYSVGKYSDVLLTPDLRILISGPGQADLSIRVNTQGDTCVDNHGANAPYVTVSSELEGGAYRVLPDQRVNFQHGSLREVVDHEPEPCGCPRTPPVQVAAAPGGPSSTPADTAFPVAQSEGLAAPPGAACRARRSRRATACRSDRSAHLRCQQASCSCSRTAGTGPGSRIGSSSGARAGGCIRSSCPGDGHPGPCAQSAPQPWVVSSTALATSFPKSSASRERATIDC